MNAKTRLVVYYNSACPVCSAGILWQQRQATDANCRVEYRDMTKEPDALAPKGVGLDDVRRYLYLIGEDGRLHRGAAAFTEIWRRTPRQRWLGRLLALPVFRAPARWLYDGFARALYDWNRRKGRW